MRHDAATNLVFNAGVALTLRTLYRPALLTLLWLTALTTLAQTQQTPPELELERSGALVAEVESAVADAAALDDEQLERWQQRLEHSYQQLLALRERAQTELARFDQQLAALGPPPAEDAPAEAQSVAEQRRALDQQRDPLLGVARRADVLLVGIESLVERLSGRRAELQTEETLRRRLSLLDLRLWRLAADELRSLQRRAAPRPEYAGLILLGVALAVFLLVRGALRSALRRLRRRSVVERFFRYSAYAGLWLYAAAGLPLAAAAAALWLGSLWLPPPRWLSAALPALAGGVLLRDIAAALLGPRDGLGRASLRALGSSVSAVLRRQLGWLALWAGLAILLYRLQTQYQDYHSLSQIGQLLLQSLLATTAVLAVRTLLQVLGDGAAVTPARRFGDRRRTLRPAGFGQGFDRHRQAMRRTLLLVLLGAAAVGAGLNPLILAVGYDALAERLFFGTLGTVLTLLLVWLTHHLLSALTELALNRLLRPLAIIYLRRRYTRRLGRLLHLLIMAAVDLLLLLALAAALIWCWRLELGAFYLPLQRLLSGVEIGQLRLTPASIGQALLVLAVAVLLTRLIRRLVDKRVLVHTRLDAGVRASLLTSINALGLMLAAALAVSVLGVALSDLVLVLGGLAIGVGFGLQHIVNNVVSGIVLLLERPLKPGDWVVVDDREGSVERIGLRATEIKTLNLASVVIPNAELVSGTVINWSLHDPSMVVEIVLTVDVDSDDELITAILLECAEAHPQVLEDPPPEVLLKGFTALGLEYELSVYIRRLNNQWQTASELRRAALRRLREAGVRLASYPLPPPV